MAADGTTSPLTLASPKVGCLKGFRTPAIHWGEGRTEAGVRKAWKEETAGEFAPTLVSIYGEFAGAG
jgi:hypothetical protein